MIGPLGKMDGATAGNLQMARKPCQVMSGVGQKDVTNLIGLGRDRAGAGAGVATETGIGNGLEIDITLVVATGIGIPAEKEGEIKEGIMIEIGTLIVDVREIEMGKETESADRQNGMEARTNDGGWRIHNAVYMKDPVIIILYNGR